MRLNDPSTHRSYTTHLVMWRNLLIYIAPVERNPNLLLSTTNNKWFGFSLLVGTETSMHKGVGPMVASRHVRRWLITALLLLLPLVTNAALPPGPVFNLLETFSLDKIPISESRVLVVSPRQDQAALALLGDADFMPVSAQQVSLLLPGTKIDVEAMLAKQVSAAEAYAEMRERDAGNPAFAGQRDWTTQTAHTHREYAAYTRRLAGKLRPFLVKGKVYDRYGGMFIVTLKGANLDIFYGTMGGSSRPADTVPLIIFVERDISSVSARASMAQ